jgi:hypothetical protein
VDYAALLTLVALAFAGVGAGAAAGLGGVPGRVAHVVRTGICIVGGDVCRRADAAAEGLAPCIVDERAHGGGVTVSVVWLRLGEKGEWTAARRSDGSVLVTRVRDGRAGAGTGVGFEAGGLSVGVSATFDLSRVGGGAWELPSTEAAAKFLAAIRGGGKPPIEPTWRFGELGEEGEVRAGFDAAGLQLPGIEGTAQAHAGVRTGRGETTVYFHAGAHLSTPFSGLSRVGAVDRRTSDAPGGGRTGPVVVAVTRDASGLRELSFRLLAADAGGARVTETVARLDLRDPANRAVAGRLLRIRVPWPPSVAADLRAVTDRIATSGTVERSVYAVTDKGREVNLAARLGVELGLDAERVDVERRLVGASAWTHGSPERRRVDCLPEA